MNKFEPSEVKTTRSGRVRGRVADGVASFLGIPFAAPPVAALRFLPPQPANPWEGIREATAYGPTAPQPSRPPTLIPEPVVDGNDFLNLNVFAPARQTGLVPVLFWIHGGGFFAGCNRSPWFDGKRFARNGIVVVAINYRLGVEGFLPVRGAPPNRAILDWIAGLEWVRDNIAAFGGDPTRVTIAGQSAGAGAAMALLAVPRAKKLFRSAILMSGSIGFAGSAALADTCARRFEAALGKPATVEALADVAREELIAAQVEATGSVLEDSPPRRVVEGLAEGLALQPLPDRDLLPVHPGTAIAAGQSADVPILMSATANEFNFLIPPDDNLVDEHTLAWGLGRLGLSPAAASNYRAAHRSAGRARLLGQAISDKVFRAPMIEVAEMRTDAAADTFVADFRWASRSTSLPGFGSCHCLDIPFAFDLLDAEGVGRVLGATPPQKLADEVHGAWVSFINTGDPGWHAYRAGHRAAMVFDDHSEVRLDAFETIKAWL